MDIKTFPIYYQGYIELVPDGEPIAILEYQIKESFGSLVMVSEDKGDFAYDEGKWTIKDIVQHIIDTERIFSYRALSFARGEQLALAGYDHEAYGKQMNTQARTLKSLLEEWKNLRISTLDLFRSFDSKMLKKIGNANGNDLSVEQILYILIGHEIHHLNIINQRYI